MITIRRQPCRILIKVRYWLLGQPDEAQLLCLLAAELPAISPSPPSARGAHQPIHPGPNEQGRDSGLGDTAVRPILAASPSTESAQTPALPSPFSPDGFPGTGKPDHPLQNRTRAHKDRAPSAQASRPDYPSPSRTAGSLVITGGMPWPK
ncbi:MAG: hypothetical protein M3Y48_10390 [Actinomycetota bacterium]|nr:hypothetical protein [Actinomycetota bacterium]